MAQELGTAIAISNLDLSKSNRRSPIPGLPDWSKAGYREGQALPSDSDIAYRITADELREKYNVIPNSSDSSEGLQKAIDFVKDNWSPKASFNRLCLIELPSGTINISRQIYVDANYLIIRGQGNNPSSPTSTKIVFRPDENTRYDKLSADGTRWDQDRMRIENQKDGNGGWIWPGRGAFRVQVRDVHDRYQDEHKNAPANRKDIYEGSVNFHWRAGLEVLQTNNYAAERGDTVIPLDNSGQNSDRMSSLQNGKFLWVQVPITAWMYKAWGAKAGHYKHFYMFDQVFKIIAVDKDNKRVTIDKPLEFHVWKNSTIDGFELIGDGKSYASKVTPLNMVEGVGFERFYLTQDMTNIPKLGGGMYNLKPEDALHNYGNLAPEYAMHGIVFKWAANCWVRNIHTFMTGSHPIVTEVAKNLQIQNNFLQGAWNKGKGGNGYLRGSRVWDSLYHNNILRDLRHFTFQWSASNNVAIGNDLDCDLNLHGGWERRNLFELNTVRVPYKHAPGECTVNCGGEGGEQDTGQWYPIWWGAGEKASKWSGATGPQNVFFNNILQKQHNGDQLGDDAPYEDYSHYYISNGSKAHTIFQFGWDRDTPNGSNWEHLSKGGVKISDWAGNETVDFSLAPQTGINALRTDSSVSLFLKEHRPSQPRNERYNERCYLCTHNSFTNKDADWILTCQSMSIAKQLKEGVRALMLDIYYKEPSSMDVMGAIPEKGVYLLHGADGVWVRGSTYTVPSQRLYQALNDVVLFIKSNPGQIVTIFLEDYTNTNELKDELEKIEGLKELIYDPDNDEKWRVKDKKAWPLISDMIEWNKRLVIFSQPKNHNNEVEKFGVAFQQHYTKENHWSIGWFGTKSECPSRWDNGKYVDADYPKLFVFNHFRDLPDYTNAVKDNDYQEIIERIDNQCSPLVKQLPNFVAVDFFELPLNEANAQNAVNELNRRWEDFSQS